MSIIPWFLNIKFTISLSLSPSSLCFPISLTFLLCVFLSFFLSKCLSLYLRMSLYKLLLSLILTLCLSLSLSLPRTHNLCLLLTQLWRNIISSHSRLDFCSKTIKYPSIQVVKKYAIYL